MPKNSRTISADLYVDNAVVPLPKNNIETGNAGGACLEADSLQNGAVPGNVLQQGFIELIQRGARVNQNLDRRSSTAALFVNLKISALSRHSKAPFECLSGRTYRVRLP